MTLKEDVLKVLGQKEGYNLEFKAVLPPSKNIAQLICSFANSAGGFIILGVLDRHSKNEIIGLSNDFHANSVTHRALDLLSPRPEILYDYISIDGKSIYAIQVLKSDTLISLEGKQYKRVKSSIALINSTEVSLKDNRYTDLKAFNDDLIAEKAKSTDSKVKLIEHYQSIVNLFNDLKNLLYPNSPHVVSDILEGKMLLRILYSSAVDNFEGYLSDLLYEIYLANPKTLISQQTVTIEEVLTCTDIQDFVKYWASQKLSKLQKGSVKAFIKENKHISDLNVIDMPTQKEIEKILQIRHIYAHRNGLTDEKFMRYFPGLYSTNEEHRMPIEEVVEKMRYLFKVVVDLDVAAIKKYRLASV